MAKKINKRRMAFFYSQIQLAIDFGVSDATLYKKIFLLYYN